MPAKPLKKDSAALKAKTLKARISPIISHGGSRGPPRKSYSIAVGQRSTRRSSGKIVDISKVKKSSTMVNKSVFKKKKTLAKKSVKKVEKKLSYIDEHGLE